MRPAAGIWSALEYACHVQDVFRIDDDRLVLMLNTDAPRDPNWDQDATAIEPQYAGQDPARVAAELLEAGERIATRFEGVTGRQWERTGSRSDGASFTIDSFACSFFIHDPVHHLHHVTSASAGGAS